MTEQSYFFSIVAFSIDKTVRTQQIELALINGGFA